MEPPLNFNLSTKGLWVTGFADNQDDLDTFVARLLELKHMLAARKDHDNERD